MVDKTKMNLLQELAESLSHATNCATGLALYSGNPPAFLVIRDALELSREGILGVASRSSILAPQRRL
jgi:hypothetical protein